MNGSNSDLESSLDCFLLFGLGDDPTLPVMSLSSSSQGRHTLDIPPGRSHGM